jgi:hypothetical protein
MQETTTRLSVIHGMWNETLESRVQENLPARFGEGRLEKGRSGTSLAAYSTMASPTLRVCSSASRSTPMATVASSASPRRPTKYGTPHGDS